MKSTLNFKSFFEILFCKLYFNLINFNCTGTTYLERKRELGAPSHQIDSNSVSYSSSHKICRTVSEFIDLTIVYNFSFNALATLISVGVHPFNVNIAGLYLPQPPMVCKFMSGHRDLIKWLAKT